MAFFAIRKRVWFVRIWNSCHVIANFILNSYCFVLRLLKNYAVKKRKRKDILTLKRAEVLEKRNLEKALIVETLKSLLNCNDLESLEIYYNYVNEIQELDVAKTAVEYLLKRKISLRVIKENGFLLSMSIGKVEKICWFFIAGICFSWLAYF